MSANIYKIIRENNNRVFVGYQNCRVFDIINTNPCFKCAGFRHGGKNCTYDPICYRCSEEHPAKECKSDTLKCPNCDFNNKKYKTNYETNHSAIDSQKCEVLKNKIRRYIESTDYPLQPTYQRYFGNVVSNFSRQTPTRQTVRNTTTLSIVNQTALPIVTQPALSTNSQLMYSSTQDNQDAIVTNKKNENTRSRLI